MNAIPFLWAAIGALAVCVAINALRGQFVTVVLLLFVGYILGAEIDARQEMRELRMFIPRTQRNVDIHTAPNIIRPLRAPQPLLVVAPITPIT